MLQENYGAMIQRRDSKSYKTSLTSNESGNGCPGLYAYHLTATLQSLNLRRNAGILNKDELYAGGLSKRVP